MPGGRGDVDRIVIAPSGVFVIDAEDLVGPVRIERPWFGEPNLRVNGRDGTKLVDGLDRQVHVVRSALDAAGRATIAVHGMLCFTRADLPIIGALQIRGHQLLYRKALAKRLNAAGAAQPSSTLRMA